MSSDLETRIQRALATVSDQQTPNLSALARSSNLPYRTLVRRFHERRNFEDKRSSQRALNLVQETALVRYIKQLNDLWAPCTLQEIERCANSILARSGEPPISKMRASRFVRRLPEGFFWIKQKPIDKKRLESEDISRLITWFEHVRGWLEGISPKNIYNLDETGFQLGQTRAQKVVTRYQYSSEKLASIDRGQIVTSIECVAADGWSMVPYLIFKGRTHMEDWFRDNPTLDQRYNIQVSLTGWSSDLIALEWLHIFHENTKNRVGTNGRRVLFFDGHGSHLTFEFLDFCDQNRIIPISFRPHTSHFAQHLDQNPFLSLKQHFRKENSLTNAWFRPDSAKRQFLEDITLIRKKAITPRIIRSAFRDTGIWPFNPNIVIGPIQKRWDERHANDPILELLGHTPEPQSSPIISPPQTVEKLNRMGIKLEKRIAKISDQIEDQTEELNRLKRDFKHYQTGQLINAEYSHELESKLLSIQARQRPIQTKRTRKQLSSLTALTPLDANRRIWKRDEQEKKLDHMRMLRAAAQDSVSTLQRLDENKDLEDFEGWVMGDDGKPLYIVDTEGVTLEKL
ncbi:hypothetical protein N7494_005079 [Penicillium frequentans]|uniref:DDE-1 domain-containing protein n=1 Tax=Penicillium frequentans TaxID=3151616 RepID=A0AAD6CXM8_9EURO|nr:hypothetical protein N7494_005079 [Penicillium glabrum]